MTKLKVIELFGGIAACSKALENLGIDYEIADYVEIDKYAVASFNVMHGTNYEPQDICKWDKDIEADLIMHGSPCQDFSLAGKQAGGGQRQWYEIITDVRNPKDRRKNKTEIRNMGERKKPSKQEAYT